METVKQYADRNEVTPQYVTRLIRKGVLKATRVANIWVIQSNEPDIADLRENEISLKFFGKPPKRRVEVSTAKLQDEESED